MESVLVPLFMDGDPRYGEVKQFDQGHIIGQGGARKRSEVFSFLV